MGDLLERYNKIVRTLSSINANIEKTKQSIADITNSEATTTAARIEKLEAQLKKIDDYVLRVDAFRTLAEKHLESKNILTIEAPPGYRVNLNRLRQWSMLIDPTSSNDPYAQRVYAVALCDKLFLEQKRQEFTERVEALKSQDDGSAEFTLKKLNEDLVRYRAELDQLSKSEEVSDFLSRVVVCNERYWYRLSPLTYQPKQENVKSISPGAYLAKLDFGEEASTRLKKKLADYYDQAGRRVLLPVEFDMGESFVVTISCAPTKDKTLDKGLQNLMLSLIENSQPGQNKIYMLDGVRYNANGVGSLRQLEDTFAMARIPRSPEQITEQLEEIVASFADIDEKLGKADSVAEYNQNETDPAQWIQKTTIIVYGWPRSFDGRNRELLLRIMTNYERYGVSIIVVSYQREGKNNASVFDLPEYATHNAVNISMQPNSTTICFSDSTPQGFTWYSFNGNLFSEYAETLKKHNIEDRTLGNEYIKRVNLDSAPEYTRGSKTITLPYGVDSKDQIHTISFNNENFAAFLMGASGSGKSTLIHTLVTGILTKYHPDDVELWLADFKMSEFAQYIDPMPPHVKYILLDESPELVFDLIDKLTEKMMERQRYFMMHRQYKNVEQVPPEVHMPIIFVILDEFSIMSQAVSESEVYKLRLQNLLAKGRALGIKFLFSSQTFTKGVNGLTPTAKDQIQTRIAMKNSATEINDTLELSMSMKTEQVRNWIDAFPAHYTLMKYREGDKMLVKRVKVLYFDGSNGDAYAPQRALINRLKELMPPSNEYDPSKVYSYVDKSPVVVDGNSYRAFDGEEVKEWIDELNSGKDVNGDEIFAFPGSPRLMVSHRPIVFAPESRQNLMLICDSSETVCGAAVLASVAESFHISGAEVEVWAYERNKLYRMTRGTVWDKYETITDVDEICSRILTMRDAIKSKEKVNEKVIILLGFDIICADMEFLGKPQKRQANSPAFPSIDRDLTSGFQSANEEESEEEKALRAAFLAAMSSDEEDEEEDDDSLEFIDVNTYDFSASTVNLDVPIISQDKTGVEEPMVEHLESIDEELDNSVYAYDAREDLQFLLQNGSRNGVHFVLYLNSYADLKSTSLRAELFRHRMSFQISADDSRLYFSNTAASKLPEHVCMYSDLIDKFSFRPYIHPGLSWDGWYIDESGKLQDPNKT